MPLCHVLNPVAADESADRRAPSPQQPIRRMKTVLLVDDHELLRLGFRALIQSAAASDIRLLEAGSLQDALNVYAERTTPIDLVVLDLGLRDTQGLEGLAAFRTRHADARIVVLSGLP